MGFFSAFGKILQGKPVFEPNQNQPSMPQQQPLAGQQPQSTPEHIGPKVYPQVYIERVLSTMNGSNMDMDVYIKNYSQTQVDLDRVEFFGHHYDLGTVLRPGEEREFRIYSGPRPNNTSQSQLELNFKDEHGDYFCTDHTMEFHQEADRTYTVNRMRFLRVRDV